MAISREEVEHVAYLVRLGLTEDEKTHFQEQLSHILDVMQVINQVETDHIPPTAQVIPLGNVMRDDQVRPCSPTEEILKNAPMRDDGYIRVKPVLE
jgi:aspartyl-tRNA(Asn)/glutamyl-tRNA(Gln) amidotransferase subunit C